MSPVDRDLALPLFPLKKFRCLWEPGQPCQPRSRSRRSASRLAGLIWTLQPGWPGRKYFNSARLNGHFATAVAVFCLICLIFHFKSLPSRCSSIKSYASRQSYDLNHDRNRFTRHNLYMVPCAVFICRFTGLKFLVWTHDRAHVKRPLLSAKRVTYTGNPRSSRQSDIGPHRQETRFMNFLYVRLLSAGFLFTNE